jgi:ABC-type cobalamin/Fe3+-siderophores transport systems, ATPase components
MIEVNGLTIDAGGRRILDSVTFRLEAGGLYGIIGPNGAGKSSLLAAISGVRRFDAGSVRLFGRGIATWPRRTLARRLAVLQQEPLPRTAFTVREVILMGRYPYQNWFGGRDAEGEALVDRVLGTLGLADHADSRLDALSGGERQRVALAKVMVQDPELLLLDEPTTYLDIGYQIHLLDLVRDWQRSGGRTVVAVLHDLNLAAQYCERLLVMHEGRLVADGPPPDVLTAETIRRVFGVEPVLLPHPASGVPQLLLQPGSLNGAPAEERSAGEPSGTAGPGQMKERTVANER